MAEQGPCWYLVGSESDGDTEYLVGLCENSLGLDAEGIEQFNGICGSPGDHIMGCADYQYRCAGQLKKEINRGKVFRCKHIRAAREHALNLLLPYMAKQNESTEEGH